MILHCGPAASSTSPSILSVSRLITASRSAMHRRSILWRYLRGAAVREKPWSCRPCAWTYTPSAATARCCAPARRRREKMRRETRANRRQQRTRAYQNVPWPAPYNVQEAVAQVGGHTQLLPSVPPVRRLGVAADYWL